MNNPFEQALVEQCAPTLAGVKPANLFRYQTNNKSELYHYVDYWNQELHEFDISVCILKECSKTNSFLIYVYRQRWLNNILCEQPHQQFLQQLNYNLDNKCSDILEQLSDRLCLEQNFPHEIGVFLGYPLYDVIGFIKHKGQNYTFSGYWKSYGDPHIAQKRFAQYRKCTALCKQKFENGIPITQLAVVA